ncbi:23S rRNA (guanosine(2251)-2'-O)-methyltransferase RlmB [Candidatus Phytoplasma pini]|uniref:RNA 2-O ribose methyltransferase n=1 Tax=Candidatus Phytoplasma pini TaxID=267362 RepID=A0A559KJJ5_9MOLU|nr:23S rRNA (guanosine(2251)-2'-O)-methyltransferase RlmB [Candidatus Phytoplasma pini]TVY12302.1 RNA 2-O ribose methyltransferase [Candidatus Phytoplasma pini]
MIIYGKNIIKEAVIAKRVIYELYIDHKMTDVSFLNFLKKKNIVYFYLSKHDLNMKASSDNHQGVVAVVQDYVYKKLEIGLKDDKLKRFLILDNIQDPHNLGAILRTIETTNFDGLIVGKKHQVLLNGTVAKAASGALEYVNIYLVDNLYKAISTLKKNQITIIGTDIKADLNFVSIPKDKSVAIIVGNEGFGIRSLLKKNCDLLCKIPMKGKINSLNVSVSAALIMYVLQ